jgi:hypothetical protein
MTIRIIHRVAAAMLVTGLLAATAYAQLMSAATWANAFLTTTGIE